MDLSASIPADLQPLVTEWLASGRYQSGQELVCDALRVLAEQEAAEDDDDFEAIDKALDSLRRGEKGMPLEQFAAEFRKQHKIE